MGEKLRPPIEINILEPKAEALHEKGLLTAPFNKDMIDPPMFIRARRAKILNQMRERLGGVIEGNDGGSNNESARELRKLAREKAKQENDELTRLYSEFVSRERVRVKWKPGEWAEAEVAILNADKPGVPIVLIPGIGNDLLGVGNLMIALAIGTKNPIYGLGLPDSEMAKMSWGYAKRVMRMGIRAHVEYFHATIEEVLRGQEKEIWGHSMGGLIAAMLLNDPEISEKVTRAVIVNPGGLVGISPLSAGLGVVAETKSATNMELPYSSVIAGKRSEFIDEGSGVVGKMISRGITGVDVCRDYGNMFRGARVMNGGIIDLVLGAKDEITKGYRAIQDVDTCQKLLRSNPQIRSICIRDGKHGYPVTYADDIVAMMYPNIEGA
jgi:pimeloyl-ACP methyl ester carboxylesterase